jgi:hypothetical protein
LKIRLKAKANCIYFRSLIGVKEQIDKERGFDLFPTWDVPKNVSTLVENIGYSRMNTTLFFIFNSRKHWIDNRLCENLKILNG